MLSKRGSRRWSVRASARRRPTLGASPDRTDSGATNSVRVFGRSLQPYSVRTMRADFSSRSRSKNLSRTWAKRRGGNGPYATVEASPSGRGLRSAPGQTNSFASVITIQDRSASRPRRFFVSMGTSTVLLGSEGRVCVIGTTRTYFSPFSSVTTNTTAQGRSFTPSSRPCSCSIFQR